MDELVDNRYRMLEPLGGGGMATVYLAHDEVLGRDVAIKVLRGEYAHDPEFVERFRQEARSAASLSHPNIVPVYDRGETEDGTYYIAMEHVPGGTLKGYVKREGPLAPARAGAVAEQVAEALSAAHGRGVIHRDIKPQNVLVTASGDVKVADFGIARAAASSATTTDSFALGTASYMAPEQAMGETATPRSDLYSLGVVLYEMLTGRLPYEGEIPAAIAIKHATAPPRPPGEINPNVPEEMDALVVGLLAKRPEDRPKSAVAVAGELRSLGGRPGERPRSRRITRRTGRTRPTGVRQRRTPDLAGAVPWLLTVLFVLATAVAGLIFWDLLGSPPVP